MDIFKRYGCNNKEEFLKALAKRYNTTYDYVATIAEVLGYKEKDYETLIDMLQDQDMADDVDFEDLFEDLDIYEDEDED